MPFVIYTKSGENERTVSRLIVFPSKPPAEGSVFTSGGKSQKSDLAASRLKAPAAHTISVAAGESVTIRSGADKAAGVWGTEEAPPFLHALITEKTASRAHTQTYNLTFIPKM